MPRLTRHERILLRHSERKDLFEEKFIEPPSSRTREFFEEESEGSHSSHKDPAQRAIRSSMGLEPQESAEYTCSARKCEYQLPPPCFPRWWCAA